MDRDQCSDRGPECLELLPEATQRLVRTVDGLDDDDWRRPSLLPGWTRAHVVAHLALNAEGMAAGAGRPWSRGRARRPMYASDERATRDIDELAGRRPRRELRDRLLAGTTLLDDAVEALPDDALGRAVRADAGWPRGPATPRSRACGCARWRSTTPTSAPATRPPTGRDAFAAHAPRRDGQADPARTSRSRCRPLDLDAHLGRRRRRGRGRCPIVTGPAADLGWWLTGRPAPATAVLLAAASCPAIGGW